MNKLPKDTAEKKAALERELAAVGEMLRTRPPGTIAVPALELYEELAEELAKLTPGREQ